MSCRDPFASSASVVRRDDDARRAAAAGLYGVLPNGNSRLAVVVEDEDVAIPPFTRYTRVAHFPVYCHAIRAHFKSDAQFNSVDRL